MATHFIRQFPLHFPSRTSTCAITFQLEPTKGDGVQALIKATDLTTFPHTRIQLNHPLGGSIFPSQVNFLTLMLNTAGTFQLLVT